MLHSPQRLKGMMDVSPEVVTFRHDVGETLQRFLARYGYREVEVPILEETELLLRKSGGELASKMYTFTDPGGHRVSLRPEFTSSIVRSYLEATPRDGHPVRLAYMGPVFRYELEGSAGQRQFTQVGAEIIGSDSAWADAELLAMAGRGISELGLRDWTLVVGDLGFIGLLLESMNLSDRGRMFILESLTELGQREDGIEKVKARAVGLGLITEGVNDRMPQTELPNEAGIAILERSLQPSSTSAIGVRTPQEIRERFSRKQLLSQNSGQLENAIELVARIAQIHGKPEEALALVRNLIDSKPALESLDKLEMTLKALAQYGLDTECVLDFGLGRGIAYYTGIVFEITHPSLSDVSLGGGGRYDGLVQALGGRNNTPAMGFAWTLDHVLELLLSENTGKNQRQVSDIVLIRSAGGIDFGKVVAEAERLRNQGTLVEVDLSGSNLEQALKYGRARGIRKVLTVDSDGKVTAADGPE
ncbi:MAG: ATP phosphoribosyltransferase regulatory subunit [Chloroflexota bacterium]|nr:ATP phosphoribosyltransferase regulatory subunit [Chloroflexota bacterium]